MDMEAKVKSLEELVAESRKEIKELQVAMVGTVDGKVTGFAQQVLKIMEKIGEHAVKLDRHDTKFETLDREKNRAEGWVKGACAAGGALGMLLINIVLKKAGIL